jgi:hypothetical protein
MDEEVRKRAVLFEHFSSMSTVQQTPATAAMKPPRADQQEITRALRTLYRTGDVVELRIPNTPHDGTASGYFDDYLKLAAALAARNGSGPGVYVTLHPVTQALLARAHNRVKVRVRVTTNDGDIVRRAWLLIDCDPVRPSGISSTGAEHVASSARARLIRKFLRELGWPEPVLADSGNGYHLLYSIDLPNDDDAKRLVENVLKALASEFDDDAVSIDRTNFNASRIVKAYGTVAAKGDSTAERPHRLSRILESPEEPEVVARELLEALAAKAEPSQPCPQPLDGAGASSGAAFDMAAFIACHQLDTNPAVPYEGGQKWLLRKCPFNAEHQGGSAALFLTEGRPGFKCQHNSCADKHFHHVLRLLEPDAERSRQARPKQSTILESLCEGVEFFHAADLRCYAAPSVDGHREIWPIRSQSFRNWLVSRFYKALKKTPSTEALNETLALFGARAQFEGPERVVGIRVLRCSESIYIHLADEAWRTVEITKSKWSIVSEASPALFTRPRGMRAMPMPVDGGDLKELKNLLNATEDQWVLIVAWLVGALHPDGPYPILVLQGEHGSCKSTVARSLRRLVDPSTAPLRTVPRDERDLAITARHSWVIAIDNLSGAPQWLSNALCRLSTGGGFGTRQLHTDEEEILFDAKRPIILNGIEDIARSPDLADRAIILTLPPLAEEKRLTEKDYWEKFEQAAPRLLGALMKAVAAAHNDIERTNIPKPPRMADFANWVHAAAAALPFDGQRFLQAYQANRRESVSLTLESSVLARAIQSLVAKEKWEGGYTELLEKLNSTATEETTKLKAWPKSARSLSNALRKIGPVLRTAGYPSTELAKDPDTNTKRIAIENTNPRPTSGLRSKHSAKE